MQLQTAEKGHVAGKTYVPAPGFHLSKSDAQKIGKSVEYFIVTNGREPTVDEFATVAKNKKDPAHEVVKRKFNEISDDAWRSAADYCIRGVDIVYVDNNGKQQGKPSKAFFVVTVPVPHQVEEKTIIIPQDRAAQSAAAIAAQEKIMRQTIRTALCDFAAIAGFTKAKRAALNEIEGIEDKCA